jgi:hypothetical protein
MPRWMWLIVVECHCVFGQRLLTDSIGVALDMG